MKQLICMLSTAHSHLDDRIYYKQVLSLATRYPSICVVAPEEALLKHYINKPGIEFVSLKSAKSLLSRFSVIPKAIITMMKIQPQVCHFHDFELIFALPFLRLFTKSKIIYDVHEVYPEMAEESQKIPNRLRFVTSKMVDFIERRLSRLAHFIITTDENISSRFRANNHNVSTIFNYPRLSLFIPDEDKVAQLKKRYEGRTPIIYNGGMDKNKGLFQMINAVKILKNRRPDIILLLLGTIEGSLREIVDKEIVDNNIQNSVELLGFKPHVDIVNYISISKVGLIANLPTKKWHKNIPIKQFEYMACGVPVLGSDLPPVASYINEAGSGRVYDSTSAEALADGVLDILKDESEWERMSESGKKATQDKWNWDEMEKRLFAVYKELIRN